MNVQGNTPRNAIRGAGVVVAAARHAFVALGCASGLLACSGHEAGIDLSQACSGSSCDAGVSATPDSGETDDAVQPEASRPTDDGATPTGDTGADASENPVSDPCPSGPIAYNCSSTCSPGTLNECAYVSCNPGFFGRDVKVARLTGSSVLRTPEKPGVDPRCTDSCNGNAHDTPHRAYAVAVTMNGQNAETFRVTVEPPWMIEQNYSFSPTYCPEQSTSQNDEKLAQKCLIVVANYPILIWTDDPNAPARNVTLEPVAFGTACN